MLYAEEGMLPITKKKLPIRRAMHHVISDGGRSPVASETVMVPRATCWYPFELHFYCSALGKAKVDSNNQDCKLFTQ